MPFTKFTSSKPLILQRLRAIMYLLIAGSIALPATGPSVLSKIGLGFQTQPETERRKERTKETQNASLRRKVLYGSFFKFFA